jgi:hypothetical protein
MPSSLARFFVGDVVEDAGGGNRELGLVMHKAYAAGREVAVKEGVDMRTVATGRLVSEMGI